MTTSNVRVLLVDDEEALLTSLATAARGKGWTVDAAHDGREALDLARRNVYDLVVTDLRMPEMEGTELIDALLHEGIGAAVVVMTGFATLEAAVECLRKGALDFLIKPFAVEDFLQSADKALSKGLRRKTGEVDWNAVQKRFHLTRRQRQVLEASYATGGSAKDLAVELSLSQHTVKSHLKAAYLKVGVSTRGQLFRAVRDQSE